MYTDAGYKELGKPRDYVSIVDELQELEGQLATTDKLTQEYRSRLEPVLRNEPSAVAQEMASPVGVPGASPLAARIRGIRTQLTTMNIRFEEMLNKMTL